MKVLVVGGAESLVKGNFGRKLDNFDVSVGWHINSGSNIDQLPAGCEGVIIISDMVSHNLSNAARDLAAKADVPVSAVPRKWSHAEPHLRTVGILPAATNGQVLQPTPGELQVHAVEYIIDQRRRGRLPKYDEVNASLQRAFGPKVKLSKSDFAEVTSKAAAIVPVLPTKDEPATPMSTQIMEWAKALIEDRAERILDLKALARTVRKDLRVIDPKMAAKYVNKAVQEIRERFLSVHPDDQKWRDPIMLGWLKRLYTAAKAGREPYPTKGMLNDKSMAIFGVTVKYGLVPDARAAVYGEWARDMLQHRKGYDYYCEVLPNAHVTFDEFMAAMADGRLKSLQAGRLTFTSKMAIDEWVGNALDEALKPVEEPKAVAVFKGDSVDEVVSVPALDPKVFVEDVVMEVAALLEGLLDRKLKPITDRIEALDKRLDAVDSKDGRLVVAMNHIDNRVGEMRTMLKEQVFSNLGFLNQVSAIQQDVDSLVMDVQGLKADVAAIKTDGEPTLRGLAEMARDTGLSVVIQTQPPKG